jgi:molybdate transport system ATP-binding protein
MKTPRLKVNIEKRLATFNLSVQIEVGAEILVMFGPSGAGKTQTLNAIAGLMTPDAGQITLDGTAFFRSAGAGTAPPLNLPARKRRVGYVFQQYALFPHLSALENVSYALWRQRGAQARAEALLERMRLGDLAHRYPHELSGGQQQRVAIARALAMEPRVLLMDEPFSALDSEIRGQLHQDLLRLQAEAELIVIYVTHNLEDAFTVGHRLAVVRNGRIEQVGEPREIFPHPPNSLVMEVRLPKDRRPVDFGVE